MTDNEIIKALKRIAQYSGFTDDVSNTLLSALDLINRQKAEIEQWKEEANKYQNLWCIALDDIEIEKAKAYTRITNIKKISRYLDNLVKEMTEENENE